MAKKNKRSMEKRRAAKALKRKQRKASLRTIRKVPSSNFLKIHDLPFWYAHGANYFASSYEDGTWTPIYDGIYSGDQIDKQQLMGRITGRYSQENGEPDPNGIPVIAWAMMPSTGVTSLYQTLVARLAATGKTHEEIKAIAKQPHNGEVWAFFHDMRNEIIKQVEKNKGS